MICAHSLRSSMLLDSSCVFFFFNDTATTEIYTLSLHDALPIFVYAQTGDKDMQIKVLKDLVPTDADEDRKSTRLNSSHLGISYAVFCLKKKNNNQCSQQQKHIHTYKPRSQSIRIYTALSTPLQQ